MGTGTCISPVPVNRKRGILTSLICCPNRDIDIIFLIVKYWWVLSRHRSLNISKKGWHSFEKTPKELIDKFYWVKLFLLLCNEIFASSSFPINIRLEIRLITNRESSRIGLGGMCHPLQLMGSYNQEDRRKYWSCLQVVGFVRWSAEQNHVSM
jgi:hypothetical protein